MSRPPKSYLSPSLQAALVRLGEQIVRRIVRQEELAAVMAALGDLPAAAAVATDGEIATLMQLHWRENAKPFWRIWQDSSASDQKFVARNPQFAFLFLCHRSGYVRAAALRVLDGPAPAPFFLAALAWRLNDWADPVRAAAVACAGRVFSQSDPAVVAGAALHLLGRIHHWGRWTREADVLDGALSRPEVVDRLAGLMSAARSGPVGALLHRAQRWPAMDRHLAMLAADAFLPHVRAMAFQALIAGKASWRTGKTWHRLDKHNRTGEWVSTFSERAVARPRGRDLLIAEAARDPAATVRRVAAAALVDLHAELPNTAEIIRLLGGDRSRGVRERIDFIRRARAAS